MPATATLRFAGSRRRRMLTRPLRSLLLGAAGLTGVWLLTACEPPAATFVVDTNVDAVDASIGDGLCATAAGECSLRAAVQEGNANADEGPIRVELGGFEVFGLTIAGAGENAAATGDLDLTRPFQFVGAGLPRVGGSVDRAFDARPGGDLQITGLEVSGVADYGGAIRAVDADLTVTGSRISGVATQEGGGIWSMMGRVMVRNTGFSKVSAPVSPAIDAAQLDLVGSSIVQATATEGSVVTVRGLADESSIETSTIVGNQANNGAIVGAAGPLTVRDSTIARNSSHSGALGGGALSVQNSIVADQVAGPDCFFPVTTSLGHNLESGTSCGFTAPGDLQSTSAGLATSMTDAGTTQVLPLANGSMAIDSGSGCLPLDQGGATRPIDGDADGIAVCDRGAVEITAYPLTLQVDTTADGVDDDPGDGLCETASGTCTIRAAVMETNARNTADLIELPGSTVHGITLAGADEDQGLTGDFDITGDLTIRSAHEGGALTFLDGNDHDRVLDVHAGTVVLERVALGDATAVAGGGALRVGAGADVTLAQSTLFANNGAGGGGGIRAAGTLAVDRSTIYSNDGGARGGAILMDPGGALQLSNSTLASNTATLGSALSVDAGASATILDSTLAGNTGIGIERVGSITVQGSIVSGHAAGNCSAPLASSGRNIDSGTTCGLTATGDTQGVDPQLGNLAGNGGATLTRLPAPTSIAIGTNTCNTPTDQRGVARPQGAACDRGSVEQ